MTNSPQNMEKESILQHAMKLVRAYPTIYSAEEIEKKLQEVLASAYFLGEQAMLEKSVEWLEKILDASDEDADNAAKNHQMYWAKARAKTKEALQALTPTT